MLDYTVRVRSLVYNEIVNTPDSVLTTVIEKTVDVGTYITQIIGSGEIYAEWSLYHNDSIVAKQRTGPSRNAEFRFDSRPLYVEVNESYAIKVIHYRAGETKNFECGVFGIEKGGLYS